jgi:hypothetical protein
MKKIVVTLLLLLPFTGVIAQPGKYAGTHKSLIGTTFSLSREIPALKGWTMKEGSLLNQINDPEYIYADVYKKGTTYMVVISIVEDTASDNFKIVEVLEIPGVQKGWTVRIGSCYKLEQPDNYIIAWGKENQDEFMKLFKKAWRFNPDKRKIEILPVKGIKCENIGC